ncbi:hypothetical protein [Serratia fonticola]
MMKVTQHFKRPYIGRRELYSHGDPLSLEEQSRSLYPKELQVAGKQQLNGKPPRRLSLDSVGTNRARQKNPQIERLIGIQRIEY